jgi:hypothetical protein
MVPLLAASSVLSEIGSAVRSGLSALSGHSSTAASSGPSFAEHLKAATSQGGVVAGLQHHVQVQGVTSPSAVSAASPMQSIVGSIVNTHA